MNQSNEVDFDTVDAASFNLAITLGNEAMQTRDDVAKALRHAADAMQAGLSDEGSIHDDNGNRVGSWAFRPEPAE